MDTSKKNIGEFMWYLTSCIDVEQRDPFNKTAVAAAKEMAKQLLAEAERESSPLFLSKAHSAINTLERLGYTYHGGEQFKPPLGEMPEWLKKELEKGNDTNR